MLVWYQPKPNEINFLPWIEHRLATRRRKRFFLYGFIVVVIVLGVAAFGVLYANLLRGQAELHRQVSEGVKQLQTRQKRVWADSLGRRRMELDRVIMAQQEFQAWLPVRELSGLLIILQSDQQLGRWQWQPIDAGHQVVFTITGINKWQGWWQEALKVWPSIQMEALEKQGDGWTFEASYVLPQNPLPLPLGSEIAAPASQPFALQLTPELLSVNIGVEVAPIAAMTHQVVKHGQGLEIVRGQGVQVNVALDSVQWVDLAPLPSAAGWSLQDLSIQQTPSGQWLVSMQWLPQVSTSPSYVMTPAPTVAVQALTHERIQHYAQAFQAKMLPTQATAIQAVVSNVTAHHKKLQIADDFQFIGYSQQQGQIPVAWVKSIVNGRLLRVEVGHEIEGWRVSAIGAQGINLLRDQQSIMLERSCLTGVCQK